MKIAIVGYGKMGRLIEQLAIQRGHEIVLKIAAQNADELTSANLQRADVAIEFSNPESGFHNVMACLEAGVNTISGTTGWIDKMPEAKRKAEEMGAGFIYASNFSLGVNLFFELTGHLARLLGPYTDYTPVIDETHHTSKKDSPSGTAISLAAAIIRQDIRYEDWTLSEKGDEDQIRIRSHRVDPAPGTHEITYESPIDKICILHEAKSREGFALGALIAAEWVKDKTGVFTMKDVLGLGTANQAVS